MRMHAIAATEEIISLMPFQVRRVAKWAECDPAGVVYAGRYTDYMLSAVHMFRRHVLQAPIGARSDEQNYGTPAKALEMVFMSSLWPEDQFNMTLYADEPGERTTHFLVAATRVDDGAAIFAGRLSSIYIDADDRRAAIKIPQKIIEILRDYSERAGTIPELLECVKK